MMTKRTPEAWGLLMCIFAKCHLIDIFLSSLTHVQDVSLDTLKREN
jgi:hypothetical protein